ncbi:MAG: heparin lyase I family protein [Spirochaetota bacterium]
MTIALFPLHHTGESPTIGINYYHLSAADPDFRNLRRDPRMLAVPGFDPKWDNVSVFFLTYGTPPVPVATTTIEKGVWIEVLVNILWSEHGDGYIRMWVDGEQITEGQNVRGKHVAGPLTISRLASTRTAVSHTRTCSTVTMSG